MLATYKSNPFGEAYSATGADDNSQHYAGQEHDAETGTEHAQFRQYDSALGIWMSPDPYLGSYDFSNPQSLNRYAYALNNPTSFVDPSGLDCTTNADGSITCDSYGPSCDTDPFASGCPPPSFPCLEYGYCGGQTGSAPTSPSIPTQATHSFGPLYLVGAAMSSGPCQQKANNIQMLRDEILDRFQAYGDNRLPLPLFGPNPAGGGSRAGHIQQIADKQTALQNALNDYRSSGCGGPSGNAGLPSDVNQVAFAPLPALSPSRPGRSSLAVPTWVAPAALGVAAAACAVFVPGCFEVELLGSAAF